MTVLKQLIIKVKYLLKAVRKLFYNLYENLKYLIKLWLGYVLNIEI